MKNKVKKIIKSSICLVILVGIIMYVITAYTYVQRSKSREITEVTNEDRAVVNTCFSLDLSKSIEINSILYRNEGYGVELEGITDIKSFINNDLNFNFPDEVLESKYENIIKDLDSKRNDIYYEDINGERFYPAANLATYNIINDNNEDKFTTAEKITFYKKDDKLCVYLYMDHSRSNGTGLTELFFTKK